VLDKRPYVLLAERSAPASRAIGYQLIHVFLRPRIT